MAGPEGYPAEEQDIYITGSGQPVVDIDGNSKNAIHVTASTSSEDTLVLIFEELKKIRVLLAAAMDVDHDVDIDIHH